MSQIPRDRRRKEFLGILVPGIKRTKESSWVKEPTITTSTIIYTKKREKGGRIGEREGERERKEGKGEREMVGGSKREGRERPSLELMGRTVLCYTRCPMTSSHDKSLRSPLLPATQQHLARAYNPSGT